MCYKMVPKIAHLFNSFLESSQIPKSMNNSLKLKSNKDKIDCTSHASVSVINTNAQLFAKGLLIASTLSCSN